MMLAPFVEITGSVKPLALGLGGVYQTLKVMRQLVNAGRVNPAIRQAATTAVFLTPELDEYSEADILYRLVRDTIRYTKDVHEVETLSTPEKTLSGRYGDCDDQTVLLAALLESVGYPTRFVVAGYSTPGQLEHVYLQTLVRGEWWNCDPCEQAGSFGWAPPDPVTVFVERI